MRGRVITVLLSLLTLSQPALPACSWTPRYSVAFRATVYDVAVDGEGFVWIATGYGVQILEQRAGGGLSFVDSVAIPGSTRVIALGGTHAYAGSGSRIHILRRNGRTLDVIRSVDAGAAVNDIVVTSYLFAATSNGIAHFDLVDPAAPVRTSVILDTSRPNVTSLSLAGASTMYAADGDLTIEVFSLALPAFPQKTGTIESLTRSSAVHATNPNGFLLVSDDLGQNTDVFIGTSKYVRVPYGSIAFAPLATNSVFVAGPDRSVRALDLTSSTRVAELFEQQLAPTGGTSNRIFAMVRSGNFLYVAAGDIGLVVFDITELLPPHPLVSYADAARTSARLAGDKAYFTDSAGTISELSVNRNGISMTPSRTWAGGAGAILRDSTTSSLLSSRESTVTLWPFESSGTASSVTFGAAVASAVHGSSGIIALLANGSVWTAASGATPQQVNLGGAKMQFLARSGSSIALAEVTDDGKTNIRYFANGDLASAARVFNLDGAATGGLALSSTHAAIFTFRGVNVVDLTSGNVRVLPESNRFVPRQLLFANDDLLVLGDKTLTVWSATSGTLLREHPLPASSVAMHAVNDLAVIASAEGSMALEIRAALPKGAPVISNSYYEEAVATDDYLYLFDNGRIDIHWIDQGTAPRFVSSVDAAGTIDIAALPRSLYALGANGSVTAYTTAGAQTAQITIDEGLDAQPLSIATAGNAVWVSIAKGCLSGTCERKTFVLDPKTLAITATMNGGAVDVATSDGRAYALFKLPDEIRAFNINDSLHPSQLANAPSPSSASAIGAALGQVYVVADKVYAFSESLIATGEFLSSAPGTGKRIAIQGDCAVITGRGANAELYTVPAWTAAGSVELPSNVRTMTRRSIGTTGTGLVFVTPKLFLLTEHSIEVWTSPGPSSPAKRRSAR